LTSDFSVELPEIQPDALQSRSLPAVSFSGLDGVKRDHQLSCALPLHGPDARQAIITVLLGRIIGFVAMAVFFAYCAYTLRHL
jgi:hypothetical protein